MFIILYGFYGERPSCAKAAAGGEMRRIVRELRRDGAAWIEVWNGTQLEEKDIGL